MSETTRKIEYGPEDRLTRHQTAIYLGITVSRLAQLRRAGEIQHEKNAKTRAVRYRFADVERLRLERSEVSA